MNYNFVLTRSVRDAAAFLDLLTGPDPDVAIGPQIPVGQASEVQRSSGGKPRTMRIGYTLDRFDGQPTDPEVRAAIVRTVELCESLGHTMVECQPTLPYESYIEATLAVWCLETAIEVDAAARLYGKAADSTNLEELTRAWADHGRKLTHLQLGRALDVLDDVRVRMNSFMAPFDAHITSTLPVPTLQIGGYDPDRRVSAEWYYESPYGQLEVNTMVFDCSGQPAISVPVETAQDGLPIGIHLSAPFGRDDVVLELARQLEEAAPWHERNPPHGVQQQVTKLH